MKPEEHIALMKEIATNLEDPVKVTALLTKVSDDYADVTTELLTAQEITKNLTTTNAELQKYNMDLFLSRGVKNQPTNEVIPEEKEIKISDLDLSGY